MSFKKINNKRVVVVNIDSSQIKNKKFENAKSIFFRRATLQNKYNFNSLNKNLKYSNNEIFRWETEGGSVGWCVILFIKISLFKIELLSLLKPEPEQAMILQTKGILLCLFF